MGHGDSINISVFFLHITMVDDATDYLGKTGEKEDRFYV